MTTNPVHRAFSKVAQLSQDDSLHALDRVAFATAATFIAAGYSYRITPSYQTTLDILKKERDLSGQHRLSTGSF